jgi:hypothetical protein
VKFAPPFTRSTRSVEVCPVSQIGSENAVTLPQTLETLALEAVEDAAVASARAAEELHFQMLCLAFVAMSG